MVSVIALVGCAASGVVQRPIVAPTPAGRLAVHEWGTFTAVAGPDGSPVLWHPLDGGSDLPSFVYGRERAQDGIRAVATKGSPATVRMETPVVYFYVDEPQIVHLSVRFVDGAITEWYPRASAFTPDGLDWGGFTVSPPNGATAYLTEPEPSHYYPARAVPEAAEVRVCDPRGDEHEKFLFYRGIGQFQPSIRGTATDQDLRVWTAGTAGPTVLAVDRAGDAVGVQAISPTTTPATLPRPARTGTVADAQAAVRAELVGAGLTPAEADAMLATWTEDWFGPGLRLVYVVPRAEVDARLPLSVTPPPTELVRVIVGRVEVPTPAEDRELAALLDRKDADDAVLAAVSDRFGRFAEPWLARSPHPRATSLVAGAGGGAID